MVPREGVEPSRARGPVDFESTASACSATSALTMFGFTRIYHDLGQAARYCIGPVPLAPRMVFDKPFYWRF